MPVLDSPFRAILANIAGFGNRYLSLSLVKVSLKKIFSLQTIAIGWIFGVKKFANCVEQMTGFKPNLYWTLTWGVIAPLVMAVIFLFYCFRWEPVKYGTVEYPPWAHTIGFFMSLSSMVWIPGYAIYWMCTTRGSIKDVSFSFSVFLVPSPVHS